MEVHEEAYFNTTIRGVSAVKAFLKEQAPALLASELLSPELMNALEDLVRSQQLLGVLRTIIQRGNLEPQVRISVVFWKSVSVVFSKSSSSNSMTFDG